MADLNKQTKAAAQTIYGQAMKETSEAVNKAVDKAVGALTQATAPKKTAVTKHKHAKVHAGYAHPAKVHKDITVKGASGRTVDSDDDNLFNKIEKADSEIHADDKELGLVGHHKHPGKDVKKMSGYHEGAENRQDAGKGTDSCFAVKICL